MAIDKRKVQEVNAGSMADIAFLLLIFFLVATTMNVDTGLARVLPAMPPDNVKVEENKIKDRNLFLVSVAGNGEVMAGQEGKRKYIDLRQLKDMVKEFVLNAANDETLPEKKDKEITMENGSMWIYQESLGVVSLQTTRETNYQDYIKVQNEIARAFNEIRDQVATDKFGGKFADLNEDQRKAVADAVQMKISEAEPRAIKKK